MTTTNPPTQLRQGDVLLIRTDLPLGEAPSGRVVLARGSSTGYAHVATGWLTDSAGERLLHVPEDSPLTHEGPPGHRHETLPLVRGVYRVRVQREISLVDGAQAQVAD